MSPVSIDATSKRYARQRILAGFGADGQARLADARVLVIGAGGLGSAVLPALAAAGIGHLTIVDDDIVDESNLHRQTLFSPADVGRGKAEAAADALTRLSPGADILPEPVRFDADTAALLAADAHLIVDASDNMPTRYLANDVASANGIPLVWGNALGWTGQAGVAWDAQGADYRDLFPEQPGDDGATCASVGVLPSVCTVVGGLMASEALKLLTGAGEPLVGRVVTYDARTARTRELQYRRSSEPRRAPSPARKAEPMDESIAPTDLKTLLDSGDPVVLLDVREPWEAETAQIPGSVLIPLGELTARYGELDSDAQTVVYCHHGMRSAQALAFLQQTAGFANARHLDGGIDAWSREVDPAVARY